MRAADFDFSLPTQLIAQSPGPERQLSRLLVLDRAKTGVEHRQFLDFPSLLRAGDVLVLNDSKVIPARLRGVNAATGGQFEVLLLEENARNDWWAMMRPGKRARVGTRITLVGPPPAVEAVVTAVNAEGHRRLEFRGTPNLLEDLDRLGEMPLPPYIRREAGATPPGDRERYQTVYAGTPGSVAAPTAGLHFTPALLDQIRSRGVCIGRVTLHVGPGTFAPVKAENLADHVMHEERYEVPPETAELVNAARREGRRVVAVGTTSLRVLESAATPAGMASGPGRTRLFVHPPFTFRIVDALLTNFHLPRSTLLMLVSAFAGHERMQAAYRHAIEQRYRFYSYGDAMVVI